MKSVFSHLANRATCCQFVDKISCYRLIDKRSHYQLIDRASLRRLIVKVYDCLTKPGACFGKTLIPGGLFVLLLGADASAQTTTAQMTTAQAISPRTVVETDSTKVINRDIPTTPDRDTAGGMKQLPDSTLTTDEAQTPLSHTASLFPQAYLADLQPFTVSIPTDGRIVLWRSGGIFGDTGQASLPGLMGVESGSLFLVQQAGRFTFTAHGDAVKYGYFGGLQTSYGFGGSISYDFSDRVGMTIFGSYYTPLHRGMTPAMQGYTSIPNFGGYVNYRFSDHWGVKVGGQAFRSSVNNRMEAQPIVVPYYRLSKNAELGIDVGGILYNIVKKNRNGAMGGSMNPTIPPPVMGPPPVR